MLLVSAGVGHWSLMPNRVLLRPVTSWAQADYSSLMPLRHRGRLWWVRAQLIDPPDSGGLSLAAVRDRIKGPGLRFAIEQACGADGFVALADLAFTELIPGEQERHHDVAFDPVRHTAADVAVWPDWLRDVREAAYSGSRQGRANHPLLS